MLEERALNEKESDSLANYHQLFKEKNLGFRGERQEVVTQYHI
jgi:hypothetical protein